MRRSPNFMFLSVLLVFVICGFTSADPPAVINFPLWVRDFQGCPYSHDNPVPRCSQWDDLRPGSSLCDGYNPMFEGWLCPLPMYYTGRVLDTLGADGTPQWNSSEPAQCMYPGGKANFDEFFRDTPHSQFVPNITAEFIWGEDPMSPASGRFGYVWDEGVNRGPYFPIDGKGYGNYCWFGPAPDGTQDPFVTQHERPECVFEIDAEVRDFDSNGLCTNPHQHNFHFSDHLAFDFKYNSTQEPWFRFQGDDDTYLYINGQLVLEVSGIDYCLDVQSEVKGTDVTITYTRICDGPAPDRVLTKKISPMVHGQNYRLEWFHVQRKVECSHHAAVFGIIPTCPPGSAGQKCGDDTGCYQWMCNNEGHCEKTPKANSCPAPNGFSCSQCDLTSPTGACKVTTTCKTASGSTDQCQMCSGDKCMWTPEYSSCNDTAQTCKACNPATGTCGVTKTCDMCSTCQSDHSSGTFPYVPKCVATPVSLACADSDQQCRSCNGTTGTCDVTRTCSKCETCQTDRVSGTTSCVPIANKCDKCSRCISQIGDPADGTCVSNINNTCDACHACQPDSSSVQGYKCVEKTPVCSACSRCTLPLGQCEPLSCQSCFQCDTAVDKCVSSVNSTCKASDPCRDYLCGIDGTCVSQNRPVNSSCSLSGSAMNECQLSQCDTSGNCVAVNMAYVPCTAPLNADLNTTLCSRYMCSNGGCVAIALEDGTNCTHKTEKDDRVCDYLTCLNGKCVFNQTLPACVGKGHRKTAAIAGIIGGAAGGVLLLVLGAAIVIYFVKIKPTIAPSSTSSSHSMYSSLLDNPIYKNDATNTNPFYSF